MKRILLFSGIVYALLAFGVVFLATLIVDPTDPQNDWGEFAKVAAIGLTLVSSLMAAVMSPLLTISQQLHIRRRSGLIEAYRHLYSAASYAYRMLAPLESGDWDVARFRDAERRLEEAEGYGFYLDREQEQLWQRIWQKVRYVSECVELDLQDIEERQQFWRKEAPELHDLMKVFKRQAKKELAKS